MTVDWVAVGFLGAVVCIAVLWWVAYGRDFMWHQLGWCTGCKRRSVSCSCPVLWLFEPDEYALWDDVKDEEGDDPL